MLCSKGYPETYENIKIENIENIELSSDEFLFHAGTEKKEKIIYSIGGRVLNFVSLSENFYEARNKIYKNLNKLNWSKGFYRRDIGYKVIK